MRDLNAEDAPLVDRIIAELDNLDDAVFQLRSIAKDVHVDPVGMHETAEYARSVALLVKKLVEELIVEVSG